MDLVMHPPRPSAHCTVANESAQLIEIKYNIRFWPWAGNEVHCRDPDAGYIGFRLKSVTLEGERTQLAVKILKRGLEP